MTITKQANRGIVAVTAALFTTADAVGSLMDHPMLAFIPAAIAPEFGFALPDLAPTTAATARRVIFGSSTAASGCRRVFRCSRQFVWGVARSSAL